MRPSLPVAGIFAGSRFFSSTMRRTDGASLSPSVFAGAAAATGLACAGAAAAGLAGAALGAAAAAPSSSTARTWPLVTDVPATILSSFNTPLTGAGTSSTTLSVSRSARFSSRLTLWPTCLCQVTSVASATDSGSWGTLISMAMMLCSSCLTRRGGGRRHLRGAGHRETLGITRPVFFVSGRECGLDEPALFELVNLADTGGRSRGRRAPCVEQFAFAHQRLQPMTDLVPGALVLRLFLAPHHFAQIRIPGEHRLGFGYGERIQPFDPDQRNFIV